ncbi:unnamed protein product [Sphagnum jensenii]|uniref:Uncharacterized protein n=1 Tax=Sphagnum jensenii TaxID=128206 RepID=A0ABP1BYQ3_9BRYO
MECTIQAHINTGTSVMSIENKRHLHWKALEDIPGMNNEVEFSAPAHNLLLKTRVENTARQAHKNHAASFQASPQAAKKKRFTKLNMTTLEPTRMDNATHTCTEREVDDGGENSPHNATKKTQGSISSLIARSRFTYD